MAQRVEVHLIDDIDGKSDATETVAFALDGVTYEIDLGAKNATKLRDSLAAYIAAGRRIGKASAGKRKGAAGGPSPREIREWAKANGYNVPDRGRIPQDVIDAYHSPK